jgi:hypothetical protein
MLKSEKAPELKLYKGLATVAWSALLSIIVYGIFVNGWDRVWVENVHFFDNGEAALTTAPAFVHMATFLGRILILHATLYTSMGTLACSWCT